MLFVVVYVPVDVLLSLVVGCLGLVCRVFRWSVYVYLFLLAIINFSISNNSAIFAL